MLKSVKSSCCLILALVASGCQCLPQSVEPVQNPAPAAWMMEEFEPTLTPRMVKELSVSPEKETEQSER